MCSAKFIIVGKMRYSIRFFFSDSTNMVLAPENQQVI